jgi:hydrogenase-4 component B
VLHTLEESWQLIIIVGSIGLFAAGAVTSLLFHKHSILNKYIAYTCSILASTGLIASGILGLTEKTLTATLYRGFFSFTDLVLRVNAFSAFFLLLIGVIGLIVTIYAIGYVSEYQERKSIALLNAGLLIFLLSMAGVVTAGSAFSFLVAWEMMSLISYFLVIYEHEKSEVQNAGFIYVVMTHIGTIFLMIAFFILQKYSGSVEFEHMNHVQMPKSVQSWVFICTLIGFGTKAGLVPMHIWLPRAHPSAPSHISALMSGIMIKTALYGFLLFILQFLQPGPIWWGIAVVLIGGNTALFGVLHAFGKTDMKRMLAYSSIENMGLMFLGIGIALIFITEEQPLLASLALMAVLFHLMNHAFFKSLLFMGAGSVLMVCHTKNMNLLGGLIRRMPWTALFMLIGSLSIAAMPPMNGFISEWMLFQSIFTLGFFGDSIVMHLFGTLMVALFAMVGALVAFLFIRFFSMTFLALPRSEIVEQSREVPISMRIGMGLLSLGCILLGVIPFVMFGVIQKSISILTGVSSIPNVVMNPTMVGTSSGKISLGITGLLIICGLIFAWLIVRFIGGKTKTLREETWACGISLNSRMTYTASGFSKHLRVAFRLLMKPSRNLIAVKDQQNPIFVHRYTYVSQIPSIIENTFYRPIMFFLVKGANIFRKIQNGIVQSYLLYLLATLVFMLIWVMGRN